MIILYKSRTYNHIWVYLNTVPQDSSVQYIVLDKQTDSTGAAVSPRTPVDATRQPEVAKQQVSIFILLFEYGGWGAVSKCIPGVKFPKYTYTLIHFNTL